MSSVKVERVPVEILGLGWLGFDHLQIVFETGLQPLKSPQDGWFVIEGLREAGPDGIILDVEGWDGGTTLSDANGGLTGEALTERLGLPTGRGSRAVVEGPASLEAWATLVSYAADIAGQRFPYIAVSPAGSPLPTINSSSLVASLLFHAGIDVDRALPHGTLLSPGLRTLLGTSGSDTLSVGHGFTTLVGGAGDDVLIGGDDPGQTDKLYGGRGNDVIRWSHGVNIIHGGQPGLAYDQDGTDTVDYSGAGELRIEAAPPGAPHLAPDFIVTHARGQDFLFSIEDIIWDVSRDRVVAGPGVGLGLGLGEGLGVGARPGVGARQLPGPSPSDGLPVSPVVGDEPIGRDPQRPRRPVSMTEPGGAPETEPETDLALGLARDGDLDETIDADTGVTLNWAEAAAFDTPLDLDIDDLLDPAALVPATDLVISSLT